MLNAHRSVFDRRSRCLALLAVPFALAAAMAPAAIAADDDFFDCTAGLLELGIDRPEATAACASSRYPGDLGNCAIEVSDLTGIAPADALNVCSRSRRPEEVANCTIDVHSLLSAPSLSAHTFCGRSLLPERYATCVIDLNEAAELSVDDALVRCIRSGYRPWEISPRL